MLGTVSGTAADRRLSRSFLALRILVAVTLAVTGLAVYETVVPTSSAASCLARGVQGYEFWRLPNGVIYGYEEPRESCDGNGVYHGKVYDNFLTSDGSCVYAQYRDGSYEGVQGYSCNSSGMNYSFYDQTGDTSAQFRLYVTYFRPGYGGIAGY